MVSSWKNNAMTTHIVTMGGGGFSMSENGSATALDRYLVELSGKRAPLVCFAPTASADDPTYIRKFLIAYGGLGVRTMVLTLWENAKASVDQLSQADVVVVGGGSTANLIALWRMHGVDQVLTRMIGSDRNIIFGGVSAGGACWYQSVLTDAFGDYRPWNNGLGVLPGSFCPHWDGEPARQPFYTDAVANGSLPPGYAVADGAALHWQDGKLLRAVTEREGAKVYRLEPSMEPATAGLISLPVDVEWLS